MTRRGDKGPSAPISVSGPGVGESASEDAAGFRGVETGARTESARRMRAMLLRAIAGAVALCTVAACAGPPHLRGVRFAHDPASTARIDHSAWDAVVSTYLKVDPRGDGVNRFDYAAVSDEDRFRLKDYLRGLGEVDIAEYDRDEQFAFWMNLYNAAIVDLVLDNAPVDSIRDIPGPGIGVRGPWLRPVATIHGRMLSFDDIEHRVLRAAFDDMGVPIHYGVNCASDGCPPLAPRAHTAENWRDNLTATARQFVNSRHGVRLDGDGLRTSKIYRSWFREDFGGSDESVIAHLVEYAAPDLARRLKGRSTIAGDFYDWRLNAVE